MPNAYESQKLLDEYLLFHYATSEEVLPHENGPAEALHFPVRSVTELLDSGTPVDRALDLGCAVGRSSFELSRFCGEVIGIDFSSAFIKAAQQISAGQSLHYNRLEEAMIASQLVAVAPADSNPDRVRFETGDATNLREDLGQFDIVHAANLLCRLPEPRKLLDRFPNLVRPGGTLALTTPCTWLEEYTPIENWPPGTTLDWLKEQLAPAFELRTTKDLPFLIRETARKFQWTVAQASVWKRK